MPDLNLTGTYDVYSSHPKKRLEDHTNWVTRRLLERTQLPFARVAALIHDVGKVNPNFQVKVNPQGGWKLCSDANANNYSSHAYLSALTFLCHPRPKALLGIDKMRDAFSVVALAARHHGNLKNFAKGDRASESVSGEVQIDMKSILNEEEYERACEHIRLCPTMPLAGFASYMLQTHVDFQVNPPPYSKLLCLCLKLEEALDFFMETQFAFGCLVESDKRDASNNDEERRRDGIRDLMAALESGLNRPPATRAEPMTAQGVALNTVRSQIRAETLTNLHAGLGQGKRIFHLASPTGSGKTLTLLAASNAILQYRNGADAAVPPVLRGVIYTLPFLSITEQVEGVCGGLVPPELMLRADSSANHPAIEKLMQAADTDPDAARKLLREDFAELIFDAPLVITTFVQFFETLMSHRNATLLKLPNFARSVIIIDEVQALPPRLYTFFIAYLDAFCRKFDAYVILATATMPNFELPEQPHLQPIDFFGGSYQEPYALVSSEHFQSDCFHRYIVEPHWQINSLEALGEAVLKESREGDSVMVVLNTIKDTRRLYQLLQEAPSELKPEVVLLNTRFIPLDRRKKIAQSKNLQPKRPLILITTQLVEAGVELDFPIVFRDLCPLPSLIQTAGRCNRHNLLPRIGRILLVDIQDDRARSHADTIYLRDMGRWYLDFTRKHIRNPIREDGLLDVQRKFFRAISKNLIMGDHPALRKEPAQSNLILCIRDAAFEDVGKFKLILEEGELYSFYVPSGRFDGSFEKLDALAKEVAQIKLFGDFQKIRLKKLELETHLRQMRERIVQARLKEKEAKELGPEKPVMGIYKLGDLRNYTAEFGLEVAEDDSYF